MLEPVTSLIDEMEFADYQVIEKVTSKSRSSQPRQNTAIWPGYNSAVFIQEDDAGKAAALFAEIDRLNAGAFNSNEQLSAFMWEAEKSAGR
jgi:hypothetical protein